MNNHRPVPFITLITSLDPAAVVHRYFDDQKFIELTDSAVSIQKETAKDYIHFTPKLLNELCLGVMNHDVPRASKILHKLKASTFLFCTDSLSAEIISLEEDVYDVGEPNYLIRIKGLVKKINMLIKELKIFEAGLGGNNITDGVR